MGGYHDGMPRTARASVGGTWYHALNRGNRREALFHKPGDYDAFVAAMIDARARVPVVSRPHHDGDLGRGMPWLLTTYARRYHRHYGTSGHVGQGRFQAFPVQDDDHLVTVLRYVERNALRAELVSRAEQWKWSSAAAHCGAAADALLEMEPWRKRWTVTEWGQYLADGELQTDLVELRQFTHAGRPLGTPDFVAALEKSTMRPLFPRKGGRPKKPSHDTKQMSFSDVA